MTVQEMADRNEAKRLMDEAVPPPLCLSDTAERQLLPLVMRLVRELREARA